MDEVIMLLGRVGGCSRRGMSGGLQPQQGHYSWCFHVSPPSGLQGKVLFKCVGFFTAVQEFRDPAMGLLLAHSPNYKARFVSMC